MVQRPWALPISSRRSEVDLQRIAPQDRLILSEPHLHTRSRAVETAIHTQHDLSGEGRRGGDQGARRERSARPSDEAGKGNNGNGGERPQVRQFRTPRISRPESTGEAGQQRIRRPRPETSGEDKG